MGIKILTLLSLWIIAKSGISNGRPSVSKLELTEAEKRAFVLSETSNGAIESRPKDPPELSKRSFNAVEFKRGVNNTSLDEVTTTLHTPSLEGLTDTVQYPEVTAMPKGEAEGTPVNEKNGSLLTSSSQEASTKKVTLQLDPSQEVPEVFYIPFSVNKTGIENETNEYKELSEVGEGHFVGYGKDYVPYTMPDALENSPDKDLLAENCQIDNKFPFKLCGSDGATYDNLSQFYCVQRQNKDLRILWDGPCDRTEWPMVMWKPDQTMMQVLNPEEIIGYLT